VQVRVDGRFNEVEAVPGCGGEHARTVKRGREAVQDAEEKMHGRFEEANKKVDGRFNEVEKRLEDAKEKMDGGFKEVHKQIVEVDQEMRDHLNHIQKASRSFLRT
jgi:tetrahydromethanopterin S-methyltransferase subunit G